MLLLGYLLLVGVSVTCVERDYFYRPNSTTWADARRQCQACYKDLTTITPTNAEVLGLNLTSDYWIGLRQNMNSSKFWSRWSNGEPVLYQNWYPGHPVPKKKPEPEPICPTPPANNSTGTDLMQCPAFKKLCACLNSSDDIDDYLMYNTTNCTASGMSCCPSLSKLCACLDSEGNETFITESTTMFLSNTVTSPAPTLFLSTSSSTVTIDNDLEPEYIEDSCVALLSFGMWQEKQCNESLPFICYDDRFYGLVNIFNVTQNGGNLSWTEVGGTIALYRVEISGTQTQSTNETSYQIEGLAPGTLYRVQVIPVQCDRDLNAQNFSFYTLPEEITSLRKVSVETNIINLSWSESRGTNVSYLVHIEPGNTTEMSQTVNYSIKDLRPGQSYNITVKAVVNETIFGKSLSIQACTKPSSVNHLTSSNNDSTTIYATWDSPDDNKSNYNYTITLDNKTHYTNIPNITFSSVQSGTKYTLTVTATEPNCSETGEAVSISAYTLPMPVSDLTLSSTDENIMATWNRPNGSFAWFILNISSPMTVNISNPYGNTTNLTYTFRLLKAAVYYTVSVVTYVKEDLKPSKEISSSIYTKPTPPGNATVQILNTSAVDLSWKAPANSQGVKNITYLVTYFSEFWNHKGSLTSIGNTSVIIGKLKSGSKYKFNITVCAGNLSSDPSETAGSTMTNIKTLSLVMLCSSSVDQNCLNSTTMQNVLKKLKGRICEKMHDNVFWNLTLVDKI